MAKALRGEIEVDLGGEKYTLRLGIGELEELDNVTGIGTLELLRSFGSNAKVSNAVHVLHQALQINGKRVAPSKVRQVIEKAGFRDAIAACIAILSAVLLDPDPGNADAVAPTEQDPTA